MPIREMPYRLREVGRLRMGQVVDGHPSRLQTWRITTPNRLAADRAAELYGGTAQPWEGAPTEGEQFEVVTTTSEIPVMIPPQDVREDQYYELWSRGGLQRRCDGAFELRNGEACLCDPENRECDIITTLLVILPDLPDLGAWRLVTKGYYAATEIPQTVEMLQQIVGPGHLPSALLSIEGRTRKTDGKTFHFPVPVLRTTQTVAELHAGPALPADRRDTPVPGNDGMAADVEPGPLSDAGVGGAPSAPAPGSNSADETSDPTAEQQTAGTEDAQATSEPAAPAEPAQSNLAAGPCEHEWTSTKPAGGAMPRGKVRCVRCGKTSTETKARVRP